MSTHTRSLCLIVCVLCISSKLNAQDDKADAARIVIDAVDAGILAWAHEIAFVGEFEYKGGASYSLEQALLSHAIPGTESSKASVSIAKLNDAFRYNFILDGPSNFDPKTGAVSLETFETGRNREVDYYFAPPQASSFDPDIEYGSKYIFMDGRKRSPGAWISGLSTQNTNPFFTCLGDGRGLEQLLKTTPRNNLRVNIDVEKPTNGSMRISVHKFDEADRLVAERIVLLNTSGRFPVVRETEVSVFRGDDKVYYERRICDEFVDCGNGCLMPRTIKICAGPLSMPSENKPVWRFESWVSQNLGERQPNPDDFVIGFDKGRKVEGLIKNEGKERFVSLIDLRLKDLDVSLNVTADVANVERSDQTLANTTGPRDSRYWYWLGFLFLVTSLSLLIWFVRGSKKLGRVSK